MLAASEIGEINAKVDLRALAVSLGATFRGKSRYGACPICGGGKTAQRFEIKTKGGAQHWVCAVCNAGGDAISLVRAVKGCDFRAAIEELGGRPSLSQAEMDKRAAERAAKASKAEADLAKFRERARRELYAIWRAAAPIAGTPVEAYLRGRGIAWRLEALQLRFVADLPYFHGEAEDERGRKAPRLVHRGPAMLAPFVGADGRFMSLHRTWIDPDRPGAKATVADPDSGEILPAKKMRGHKLGGRLEICADGDRAACASGEGIETTLSVRESCRDGRFYFAAGDWGNMAGASIESVAHPTLTQANGRPLRVPGPDPDFTREAMAVPAECRELILLRDGDSDPFTTDLVMRRAAARHAAPGRVVRVASPTPGADFNDMLRGAA